MIFVTHAVKKLGPFRVEIAEIQPREPGDSDVLKVCCTYHNVNDGEPAASAKGSN